ncbi:MAG: hypothetical protein K6A81_02150 [Clostridiales bacterium]|nr:hypothetical protein [Clostridiales bacterium]
MSKDTDKTTNENTNNEAKRFSRRKIAVVSVCCVLGAALIGTGAFLALKGKGGEKAETEASGFTRDKGTLVKISGLQPDGEDKDSYFVFSDPDLNVRIPDNDIELSFEQAQDDDWDAAFKIPEVSDEEPCQVTDEMVAYMKKQAAEAFEHYDKNLIPDAFEVEDFHYVGFVSYRIRSITKEATVTLYYQVTISEEDGSDTLYHSYFWSWTFYVEYDADFARVTGIGSPLAKEIYFGKWGVHGFSSIDVDRMQRERNGEAPEIDTVDPELFSPLPGEDQYYTQHLERVTSCEDVNEGQKDHLINEAMNQLEYFRRPYGADLDEIRYKGMAVASNGGSSTVFVILEVQATMNKDTSSEDHLTYYWYTGFTEVYKSGELDDAYIVYPSTKISVGGWDGTGFTSIDALRKAIVHLSGDGNYDLHLEE